ncbi:hypothetical protein EC968_004603 [Mortierella alpina]|nr:hypothetical protein EC968_004603 [Mortierella alpina]
MGGSGSGKTTLLNVLADRVDKQQTAISGTIQINGEDPKIYRKTRQIGYLQQEDYLLPYITVRETLQTASDLRFPSMMPQQEKKQVVDGLILELGLKNCADVLIGNAYASESGTGGTRGISGGERRRVSAAIQLLTRPGLLICDEVTSGLDAFTAFELVKTLEKYARLDDKTVILSIHQPRSEIFHLLSSSGSQLVLLAQGDVVYSGPLDKALSWFESIGLEPCSKHVNPFDYILDLSMVDSSTAATERSSRARIAMLIDAWSTKDTTNTGGDIVQSLETVPCDNPTPQHDEQALEELGPGIWSQTCTLRNRAWKSQIRNRQMLWGNFLFCILMSLAVGVIFWRTDNSSIESIRARTSACFILGLFQPFSNVIVDIIEYAKDIKVYERERRDGWYTPLPYLLSHLICAIPRNILHSVGHVSIVFFAVNLRSDSSSSTCFLIVALTYMAMQFVRNVLAMVLVSLLRNFEYASIAASAVMVAFSLSCGYLVPIGRLPIALGWIRHIALSHVGYRVMVSSVFSDLVLPLGLSGNSLLEGILEVPVHYYPVMINVQKLSLAVEEKAQGLSRRERLHHLFSGQRSRIQKSLLQDIDAVIPAAQLTAILGSSGSGKTTLLNAILNRTPPGLRTSGDIYFNGSKNPSMQKINTVCGYVRQDDGMLMAHLTVRETLRYAAELGMAKSLTKIEKWAKVDEIIDLIGLTECRDVLVGDDDTSGISGGQRRRVSIGLQLVNEPACLFLDEPTSGLDALTAKTLVLTLKEIALAGRTVVCAIHQPRIDIWNEFDNVLLLMTGGRLAYAGKASDAIAYFERAGYTPPEQTSVPDFIIDSVSISHRSPELEATSRAVTDSFYVLHCQQQNVDPTLLESATTDFKLQEPLGRVPPHYAGFLQASFILTRRNFTDTFRQRGRYFDRIVAPFTVVTIACLFFWKMGSDLLSVYARLGCLQQFAGGALPSILVALDLYPRQREVAFREISNGSYSASAFFASYLLNEVPLTIVSSFLLTAMGIFVTGFKLSIDTAFKGYITWFGYISLGETMTLTFSTLLPYGGLSFIASSATILWLTFIAGIMTQKLPWPLECLNFVNPYSYAFRFLLQGLLQGFKIQCSQREIQKGLCIFTSGEQVLKYLKMEDHNPSRDVLAFVGICVLYRMIAWAVIVLRVRRYPQ